MAGSLDDRLPPGGGRAARVTLLSSMASDDFESALDLHVRWGVKDVDLKDAIFGKALLDLTDDDAHRAKELVEERGLSVYCLSSVLFASPVESGKARLGEDLARLSRLLELAEVLQPTLVRFLAPSLDARDDVLDSTPYLQRKHPWLFSGFREAVDRVSASGFRAAIENESVRSIFRTGDDVRAFFDLLDRPRDAVFIWDVSNMWQMGTFPTVELSDQLRPVVGYLHLKGGQHDGGSRALRWASALEDASWPVAEIARRSVAAGGCEVICLNPPHGERRPGYDYARLLERDLEFVRRAVTAVA